jgi:hypothetical protein
LDQFKPAGVKHKLEYGSLLSGVESNLKSKIRKSAYERYKKFVLDHIDYQQQLNKIQQLLLE